MLAAFACLSKRLRISSAPRKPTSILRLYLWSRATNTTKTQTRINDCGYTKLGRHLAFDVEQPARTLALRRLQSALAFPPKLAVLQDRRSSAPLILVCPAQAIRVKQLSDIFCKGESNHTLPKIHEAPRTLSSSYTSFAIIACSSKRCWSSFVVYAEGRYFPHKRPSLTRLISFSGLPFS